MRQAASSSFTLQPLNTYSRHGKCPLTQGACLPRRQWQVKGTSPRPYLGIYVSTDTEQILHYLCTIIIYVGTQVVIEIARWTLGKIEGASQDLGIESSRVESNGIGYPVVLVTRSPEMSLLLQL